MRATEFLVEYDKNKTVSVFGRKLIAAMLKDNGNMPTPSLDRQLTLLNSPDMNGIELDQQTISHIGGLIVGILSEADPTPHKQYTAWLCKCYANEGIKLEDLISRGADWLQLYHELKVHKLLTPDINDINRLMFQQLYQIVSDPSINGELLKAKEATMPKGESKVIMNNVGVRIIQPLDENSAKYYGRGSIWCTAANNNNMFDRYNKQGPMFIMLPKKPEYDGEKYQVHFASGSFMNQEDEPVDPINLIVDRFGDLRQQLSWLDSSMTKLIPFAPDELLAKIVSDVKDLAIEYLNDLEMTWQQNDESYVEWLQAEGYVDENYDIDWDNAPSYLEYDDDAKKLYNNLINAVSPSVGEVIDASTEWGHEVEATALLKDMDNVLAWIITHKPESRYEADPYENLAEWIMQKVIVDSYGNVSKVKSRPQFKPSV